MFVFGVGKPNKMMAFREKLEDDKKFAIDAK